MGAETILSFQNVTKKYPGVVAIHNLSLELKQGEVHALVGENGAGKSTLIKCLSGAIEPTQGSITLDGTIYEKMTPRISREKGIEVIYQELNLIDGLSVSENVCLGEEYSSVVNFKVLNEKAASVFEKMGVSIDPEKKVYLLSTAQQQLVEIAKSLIKNVRILIMDEPTAPLTNEEVEILFNIIEKLKKDGVTIVYISHRLDEIFRVSDRVSVLRDGELIRTMDTDMTNRQELINLMVGRTLTETFPVRNNSFEEKALELLHVSGNGDKDINLYVNKGEIVGLAGLVGAGRTELVRMIYGADAMDSGTIRLDGKEMKIHSPKEAIERGVGLIPEDRKQQGCFLRNPVDWNITIANIRQLSKNGVMDFKQIEKQALYYKEMLNIKTPSLKQLVMNLSGGNQQKVVLAKTLAGNCDLIIFDEPTRGIDVGAKQEIYQLMTDLVNEGKAILMVSSDMEELLGMSDRIYVLANGRIHGELKKEEATQIRIMEIISNHAKGDKVE